MQARAMFAADGSFVIGPPSRLVQSAFALVLVVDAVDRAVESSPSEVLWPLLAAVIVVVVSLWVAVIDPPADAPGSLVLVLSAIDIALVGMTLISDRPSAAPVVIVLPCLWLGLRYGARGVAAATVLTGTFVIGILRVPGAVVDVTFDDALILTLIGGISAAASAALARSAYTAAGAADQRLADLHSVLEAVDVSILVIDADGEIRVQNRGHENMVERAYPEGYPGLKDGPHDLYLADGVDPVPYEERPNVLAARGREFDNYLVWIGSDPVTRVAATIAARTVRDAEGRQTGAVLTGRDVTPMIQAMRTRDAFVSTASHELRTPLASITAFLHLLRLRQDLPDEAQEDLAGIDRNVERLSRLVNDLVDNARAEHPSLNLFHRTLDLASVVHQCATRMAPTAREAGVRLLVDAPSLRCADLDAARLATTLDALVGRAVARSPKRGAVRLSLADDGTRVDLTVADDGAPLTEEERGRLTGAPGLPAASSPGDEALESCRLVAVSHCGRVEVDPEGSSGTAIRLRLPRGLDAIRQEQVAQVP